ncbi:MAG TPA: hypothetical protein VEM41_03030 [Actinomycetota bacterium]|nr:hypothetical protein [Actinomycetota bacterium]
MGSIGVTFAGWLGAMVNLDHPAHYVHWGWFQISTANLVVILLMIVVFVLALFVPFPGRRFQ